MNKNLDKKIEQYSKIKFDDDLGHLENDVRRRIFSRKKDRITVQYLMEKWLGIPVSMGVSAIAFTLVVGVFLGTQLDHMDRARGHGQGDVLGLDVFSASHAQLPSTLLVSKK